MEKGLDPRFFFIASDALLEIAALFHDIPCFSRIVPWSMVLKPRLPPRSVAFQAFPFVTS